MEREIIYISHILSPDKQPLSEKINIGDNTLVLYRNPDTDYSFYTPSLLRVYYRQVRQELGVRENAMLTDEQREYARIRRVALDDAVLKGMPVLRQRLAEKPIIYPFPNQEVGKYRYSIQNGKVIWELIPNSDALLDRINFQRLTQQEHIPVKGETEINEDLYLAKEALEIGLGIQKSQIQQLGQNVNLVTELLRNPVFNQMSKDCEVIQDFDRYEREYKKVTDLTSNKHLLESEENFKIRAILAENPQTYHQLISQWKDVKRKSESITRLAFNIRYGPEGKLLTSEMYDKTRNGLALLVLCGKRYQEPRLITPGVDIDKKNAVITRLKKIAEDIIQNSDFNLVDTIVEIDLQGAGTDKKSWWLAEPDEDILYFIDLYREYFKKKGIDEEIGLRLIRTAVTSLIKVVLKGKTAEQIDAVAIFDSPKSNAEIKVVIPEKPEPESEPEQSKIQKFTPEEIEKWRTAFIEGIAKGYNNLSVPLKQQLLEEFIIQPQTEPKDIRLVYNFLRTINFKYSMRRRDFEYYKGDVVRTRSFYEILINQVEAENQAVIENLKSMIITAEFSNLTRSVRRVEPLRDNFTYNPIEIFSIIKSQAKAIAREIVINKISIPYLTDSDWNTQSEQLVKKAWAEFAVPTYYEKIKLFESDPSLVVIRNLYEFNDLVKEYIKTYAQSLGEMVNKLVVPDTKTFIRQSLEKALVGVGYKPSGYRPTGKLRVAD